MREFINRFPVTLLAAGSVELVVSIPNGFKRWTLVVVPINTAASPDPVTFELQYPANGSFFPRNPAGTGTLLVNQANVITSEDLIERVKVKITCGATKPDGDAVVELSGAR